MEQRAELKVEQGKIKCEELESQIGQLEEDLDAAAKKAEEAEEVENKMYDDFQKDMKKELDSKMDALRVGASAASRMDTIEDRLLTGVDDHRTGIIKSRQTDILRTNKVIRDISRALGTDWKGIFRYLLAATFSKDDIDKHILRIEKQNMAMTQAYKALLVWRDTKEDYMGLTQLADGLRINKKVELADYVLDTLECEGDALFKLNLTATGDTATEEAEKGTGETNGDAGAKVKSTLKLQKPTSSIGLLDDRKFLQLAKKIGGEWQEVATTLGLAEEDIKEILDSEGTTYHGAFKMLWTWRDRTVELDQDNPQILREALKACEKADAAEIV